MRWKKVMLLSAALMLAGTGCAAHKAASRFGDSLGASLGRELGASLERIAAPVTQPLVQPSAPGATVGRYEALAGFGSLLLLSLAKWYDGRRRAAAGGTAGGNGHGNGTGKAAP